MGWVRGHRWQEGEEVGWEQRPGYHLGLVIHFQCGPGQLLDKSLGISHCEVSVFQYLNKYSFC